MRVHVHPSPARAPSCRRTIAPWCRAPRAANASRVGGEAFDHECSLPPHGDEQAHANTHAHVQLGRALQLPAEPCGEPFAAGPSSVFVCNGVKGHAGPHSARS